ncbi:MAG: AAA family ATPase [Caldilineaceae bacterium]|nr:AAA family ATPase [Caldilineaceae bacterium]
MTPKPRYPVRNYAVGQLLFTLRRRAQLTQAELGAHVGVHRRSIQKWESGETYPTADNLRTLIQALLQLAVFTPTTALDEVTALWELISQHSPQQFPPFDRTWFVQLSAVASEGPPQLAEPAPTTKPMQELPIQGMPLVGRTSERKAIAHLLTNPACRLLTLLGPGGIGKTRLAAAIAAEHRSFFRDGVAFVPLASAVTQNQVITALIEALPLALTAQTPARSNPLTALLDYVRPLQMLLVLDDFEHLLHEGVDLVSALIQAAPQLTILVTSRARLNLQAEWLFDVKGLPYPVSDSHGHLPLLSTAEWHSYSAIELFLLRATQLQPDLVPSAAMFAAIGRICQQVAGIPLAIELAAATVRTLPVAEIEQAIGIHVDSLATTFHDVPSRHRTLRAVFDHSWHLLSEAERILVSRLSIFRGGWNQTAVEAICHHLSRQNEHSWRFSPPILAALVDKSLVRREVSTAHSNDTSQDASRAAGTSQPRFGMLEPIREYAWEQLVALGEDRLLQRAHASYYLTLAEAAAAQWAGPTAAATIAQLDLERDNLRAALQWTRDSQEAVGARTPQFLGLQLAGALVKFWRRRGLLTEGRAWLAEFLALTEKQSQDTDSPDPGFYAARLRALVGAAWLASDQHDYERATQLFEESLLLRRALGQREEDTQLLVNQALQARSMGAYRRATTLLEDALAHQRALGNRGSLGSFGIGQSLFLLGLVRREQGDFTQAMALFEECVQLHRALADREGLAMGLLALSDIARDQGNAAQARHYAAQSLLILRELEAKWAIGFVLNNLALAAYQSDDFPAARPLINESVALFRAQKAAGSLAEALITLGQILQAQQQWAAAQTALLESLQLAWSVGPRLMIAMALEALARLTAQLTTQRIIAPASTQETALAVSMLAAAAMLRVEMGTPLRPVDQAANEQTLATLRSRLGATAVATLWAQARTFPLADLMARLLTTGTTITEQPNEPTPPLTLLARPTLPEQSMARVDWGLAQDVPVLYGRTDELATLTHWGVGEQCRVMSIIGLGGIGKTSLAVTFGRQHLAHFSVIIFRSLGEAPPLLDLLDQLIHGLSTGQSVAPTPLGEKLALLITLLRQQRALLILDNLETLLQAGATHAAYLPGYEGYGTLFKTIGETAHQSCLLLTSRERPHELAALEGPRNPVRSLRLTGLTAAACQALLADQDLVGTAGEAAALAQRYGGNPLALKLVAEPIRALFSGNVAAFLTEGDLFFNGVGQLLAQQISRATPVEQQLLAWLAIGREPITLEQLMAALAESAPREATPRTLTRATVLTALHALWQRNLIELGQTHLTFTLQRVVLEYLTEHLITSISDELLNHTFVAVSRYALVQATAKEYIRHSQERLLANPILERLVAFYGGSEQFAEEILARLAMLRAKPLMEQGYAPGNLINLLRLLRGHLRGLDLTRLAIRQAYLQGVELRDSTLADAFVRDTLFTDTFDVMTAVTISRDGSAWAAISRRGEVWIWRADHHPTDHHPTDHHPTGPITFHRTWQAHTALAWTLAFSPDGGTLASGSWDGTIKLWEVATGTLRWVGRHTGQVNRVAFAADGHRVASCGSDGVVRLWDVQSGQLLQALAHPDPVAVIAWSPTHQLLVSGDLAGVLRCWALQEASAVGTCVQTLREHTTWVDGLAFTPNGLLLASASYDGTVKLWDLVPPLHNQASAEPKVWLRLQETLTTQLAWAHRLSWSADGRLLASCSFDRIIWLWDREARHYRVPLQGHLAVVYDIAMTPDSTRLFSCSEDGSLRIWDLTNGQCMHVMTGYTGALYDVDWNPSESHQVASVGTDASVTLYAVMTSAAATDRLQPPAQVLRGHTNSVFGVSWSPNGRWIASSELDNAIRLWDTKAPGGVLVLQHTADPTNLFYGITWSPDSQRLASGTAKHGIIVWDIQRQQPLWQGAPPLNKIRQVAWHPTVDLIAGGGEDGIVYLWDAATGAIVNQLRGHESMITRLVWNPAGTLLAASASGNEHGELSVWDIASGTLNGAFIDHPGPVNGVAWGWAAMPGEALPLISGGGDGLLRWWDVAAGRCLRWQAAHEGAVQALRRSPDGKQVATCGDDGTIKIWELQSGELRQTLRRDRPYERLTIRGLTGLTIAQRTALLALGALE